MAKLLDCVELVLLSIQTGHWRISLCIRHILRTSH